MVQTTSSVVEVAEVRFIITPVVPDLAFVCAALYLTIVPGAESTLAGVGVTVAAGVVGEVNEVEAGLDEGVKSFFRIFLVEIVFIGVAPRIILEVVIYNLA